MKTTALSEVNQGILEVARDSLDCEQEWEFFCECGREDCHQYVSLTLDAYSALHDYGQPVLADGHPLSQIEARPKAWRRRTSPTRTGVPPNERSDRELGISRDLREDGAAS